MQTYDYALVRQQKQREAFIADRNFILYNVLFIAVNVGFWVYLLLR